ncbi:MAG: LysR family transcriptional regulator [Thiolinea sp.]
MDIAHLKTFLEIYRIRHFGKAAEKLCITQSAASARIKLLEERLGVSLFVRDRNAIEPTPAGHRFHRYAEMTVNGWERARQMVTLPESYVRSLALGCPADIWHLFLVPHVDRLHQQLPDTALNLSLHLGHQVQELLLAGTLDLGLVFEPINMPMLQAVEITALNLQLFANYPAGSLAEAMGEGYIMVDWGTLFEYEHSRRFADLPAAPIRTSAGMMALDLLQTGRRAAYLPERLTVQHPAGKRLYPVTAAPLFERHLFAVFRHGHDQHDLLQQVVAILSETLPAG